MLFSKKKKKKNVILTFCFDLIDAHILHFLFVCQLGHSLHKIFVLTLFTQLFQTDMYEETV